MRPKDWEQVATELGLTVKWLGSGVEGEIDGYKVKARNRRQGAGNDILVQFDEYPPGVRIGPPGFKARSQGKLAAGLKKRFSSKTITFVGEHGTVAVTADGRDLLEAWLTAEHRSVLGGLGGGFQVHWEVGHNHTRWRRNPLAESSDEVMQMVGDLLAALQSLAR
jgi:hypothetical protein